MEKILSTIPLIEKQDLAVGEKAESRGYVMIIKSVLQRCPEILSYLQTLVD
jgi:hypothetical protein